ncbi:MAG: TlpA family protein disulfide reductase [Gammaproteobacteria bacterium]|nr:TlpA family protein disulfide reductase [Gammaproteobacteria bacterium]NVK89564.1 TlpA family protein disulfide reductase [Gammaproteobacteria bacterium]
MYKYRTFGASCLILLSSFFLGSCQQAQDDSAFWLLNGEKRQLQDYDGGWLLINFWAEWCRPCLEEVPDLNRLHQPSGKPGLTVVAFSYEQETSEKLRSAQQRYQMEYPLVLSDPIPRVPFAMPNKLPAFYLRHPNGELFGPYFGKKALLQVKDEIKRLE